MPVTSASGNGVYALAFEDTSGVTTDLTATFTSGMGVNRWGTYGDGTLHVCAGTYTATISVHGAAVDIMGVDGRDVTVLSGDDTDTVLSVDGGAVVDVVGLTFSGGRSRVVAATDSMLSGHQVDVVDSPQGRGLDVRNSTVELVDCVVSGNEATSDGGGLYAYGGADVALDSCTINGNTAVGSGGGAYLGTNATLVLIDSEVSNNAAEEDGGGIALDWGALELTRVTVAGNTATSGGGLHVLDQLDATDAIVDGNQATASGGGIYADHSGTTASTVVGGSVSSNAQA